eukprot:8534720-Heterocapsa_arctica.AAC.1
MHNEGFIVRNGPPTEITAVQDQGRNYDKEQAFIGLISLKQHHASNDTVVLVMNNLPANRLWTTVAFHGLGHFLFLSKYIKDGPGPEDIVDKIISEAARGNTW